MSQTNSANQERTCSDLDVDESLPPRFTLTGYGRKMNVLALAIKLSGFVCLMSFGCAVQCDLRADDHARIISKLGTSAGYPEDMPIKLAVEEFNLRTKEIRARLGMADLSESELFAALKVLMVRRGEISEGDATMLGRLADLGKVPKGSMLDILGLIVFENEDGKSGTWNVEVGHIYLTINYSAATGGELDVDKVKSIIVRIQFNKAELLK